MQEPSEHQITPANNGGLLDASVLRQKIIKFLETEGFCIYPNLTPNSFEKNSLRIIHAKKKEEQLRFHKNFVIKKLELAKKYSINGFNLNPDKINLELLEVKPNTEESDLFLWWNLIWWSLPYDKPIGRQMRFILWDKGHNAPFGLICLQSPPLNSPARDKFLKLLGADSDYWINQSMYAQRVGALPPYNQLIGGKMVALSLVCNEIRNIYAKKYENRETLMKKRKIPNKLLFITTTSAFGKSSMYDRINFNKEKVSEFMGFTSGAGTFHISEPLYLELLAFLEQKGVKTKRGYGTGTSRKLRLINQGLRMIKIPNYSFHNIKRGSYLFSNTSNLDDVLHRNEEPKWIDRPFSTLFNYWRKRWCEPRSATRKEWRNYDSDSFFAEVSLKLRTIE